MAVVTAAIGAAAMGVGGFLQSQSQSAAAQRASELAAFNPFNISGAGGNVNFEGGAASVSPDQMTQMFQSLFGANTSNLLGGGAPNQGAIDFSNTIGNNFGGFLNQASTLGDPSSAIAAQGQFGQFAGQNALFGQQGGMNALGLASSFGQAQTGINEGVAQGLFGAGGAALGNTDFSSLAADQLSRSRAAARPGEERAVNSKFQNLFSSGILSSTSGNRQIGELALGQELADTQRVNSSEQFANMLQQQNRSFGLNAIGGGLQARSQDQQGNIARAGLFGSFGQGLLNFGQGAAQSGLNSAFGLSNLMNTRGQERLQNAMGLFGIGQGAQAQNFNQALGGFGVNTQINADMRNLIALGGNLGSAGAAAGANQGQFLLEGAGSPLGSFFSGVGSGLQSEAFA